MISYAELERWIDGLRGRLERGDLADLEPFDVGDGTGHLPAEHTIRLMLAELDDLHLPPYPNDQRGNVQQRLGELLNRFRRLRKLLE
jgi:hypothetical protein